MSDCSIEKSVSLEAYLDVAMALIGLARTVDDPDRLNEVVAIARRAYDTAASIVARIPESKQREHVCEKHEELANAIDDVERRSSPQKIKAT